MKSPATIAMNTTTKIATHHGSSGERPGELGDVMMAAVYPPTAKNAT